MVAEYGNRLLAAATLLCPNDHDAEELVFRTFEQAIKKIRQFKPTGDFYKWLYTILLNFRRMDARRKRLDVISFGSSCDLPEVPVDGLVNLISASQAEVVRESVRRLTEPLRVVMVLRYFEGRSIDEISEMLAIPTGTVKSRIFNAKNELSVILKRKEWK